MRADALHALYRHGWGSEAEDLQQLEAIADDLPFRVDRLQRLGVAGGMRPLRRECHRFEKEIVIPTCIQAK